MWLESFQQLRSGIAAGQAGDADQRQEFGPDAAETCLADDHMARRHEQSFALALCPRPGTHGTDQARRRAAGRNAANRVARGRGRARQVLEYWLSTVDKNISFRALVDLAKMRWRVERDYQELKQEVGLGHYEGRSWPGFHHHATLCI